MPEDCSTNQHNQTIKFWLNFCIKQQKQNLITLLTLGIIWSSCEVCLPFIWSQQAKPELICLIVWLTGQCASRAQGFIGAKLWPKLTSTIKQTYWQNSLKQSTATNLQLIAINNFFFFLKNLAINLIYRLITPLGFALIALFALTQLNLKAALIIATWLFGHICISSLFNKKILVLASKVSQANISLQNLERNLIINNQALKQLVSTNKVNYHINISINTQVEVILLLQSGWLISLVLLYCWHLPSTPPNQFTATILIWLQLSNQIWNLGANWHSLLQDYGSLLELSKKI